MKIFITLLFYIYFTGNILAEGNIFPDKLIILGKEVCLKEKQSDPSKGFLAEYIPSGNTWDNWNLMFAVRFMLGENLDPFASAKSTESNILERKKNGDPVANAQVFISKDGKSAVVDFLISSENIYEHNVWRFFKSKKGVVSYQIARRMYTSNNSVEEIKTFIKDIAKLREQLFNELNKQELPMPNIN